MKDIKGFEGLYAVTEDGRVWSQPRTLVNKYGWVRRWKGRFLKPGCCGGYSLVTLGNTSRTNALVHRIVAETFIPNPTNLPQVNHKNGVKSDNRIENLEWMTLQDNMRHAVSMGLKPRGDKHPMAKLNDTQIIAIRKLGRSNLNALSIAKQFGIGKTHVWRIIRRETWKHLDG